MKPGGWKWTAEDERSHELSSAMFEATTRPAIDDLEFLDLHDYDERTKFIHAVYPVERFNHMMWSFLGRKVGSV